MQKRDVAEIGLKLLGVYFAVYGTVTLVASLARLPGDLARVSTGPGLIDLFAFPFVMDGSVRAAAFLIAAYMLLRHTATCLRRAWGDLLEDAERMSG